MKISEIFILIEDIDFFVYLKKIYGSKKMM